MPDPLFTDLYDDTRALAWPDTAQVRARAAQRTRRQRLAAASAVAAAVVAVAGGAAALAEPLANRPTPPAPADSPGRPTPTTPAPSPPASTPTTANPLSGTPSSGTGDAGSPVRTAGPAIIRPLPQGPVPPAAMLQPVDVGRGEYGVFDHVGRSGSGDWRMPLNQTNCAPNIDARPRAVLAHHERSLVNENAPDKTLVTERVVRFATAGEARRHLDDVQAMVRACLGDGVFLSVVVHDFAGPGSMVVRSMADADTKTLHVWVRRGNLVAEVWAKSMPTDQQAVRLGERAAARLCVGTIC